MELLLRVIVFVFMAVRALMLPLRLLRSWRKQNPVLPPLSDPLLTISATRLAARIRSGQVTSEEAVAAYVQRVRAVNPLLNAVVEERFAAALEEAREVDRALAGGRADAQRLARDKPLLGVPITVKESCGLKGMSFCVGTQRRRGLKSPEDGEAVARLRAAGAIPLCVTTTPELCLGWEANNLVTGITRNPFDLRRSPGGSSSGEAALIGAGASPMGIGSDIAGSIRVPAHCVGIFGHKPSAGYAPLTGNYPLSEDPDFQKYLVVGPLCRYAEDLRLGLTVMSGAAGRKLRLDEPVDMSKLRVYIMETIGPAGVVSVAGEIRECVNRAAKYLQKQHKVDVRKVNVPELDDSLEISGASFFCMSGIPDLLEDPVDPKVHHNLWLEVLKSLVGLSNISLQAVGFTLLHNLNLFIPQKQVPHYHKKRDELKAKLMEMLGEDGVILCPTYPDEANFHNEVLVKTVSVLYTMIFNILEMPATHVPLGFNKFGMPIGVQVAAAPHQDRLCLAVAEALEKGFGGWEPPPAAV